MLQIQALPNAASQHASNLVRALGDGPTLGAPRGDSVMVVAPHPADETIMCGGTIRSLVEGGATVGLVAVTDGERGGDPNLAPSQTRLRRRAEQERASEVLGISSIVRLSLPDGELTECQADLVASLSGVFSDVEPDLILTPWWGEAHADHAAVAQAVAEAVQHKGEVWAGEVWTPLSPSFADSLSVRRP